MNKILIVILSIVLTSVGIKTNATSINNDISKNSLKENIANYLITEDKSLLAETISNELSKLDYYEIPGFGEQIQSLHTFLKQKNDSGMLYLQTLRVTSLLNYQSRQYKLAISQFDEYFSLYNNLLKTDTGYAFEYSKYSYSHYLLKDYDRFLELSEKGIAISNKKKYPQIDKCYFYINLGKYFRTMMMLDSSQKYANMAQQEYENAIYSNNKVISDIYKLKSKIELLSDNFELSNIYIEKAINHLLSGKHSELSLADLYLKKAQTFVFTNQLEKAIDLYQMVIHVYEEEIPGSKPLSKSYYNIGMAYYILEDYNTSLKYFKKALEINDDISNFYVHRYLANIYSAIDSIYLSEKKYREVLNYLEKSTKPDQFQIALTKFSFGQLLLEKTDKYAEGEKLLGECISGYYLHFDGNNSNLIFPLNIIGTHYIKTGQIERGLDSLQKALEIAAPGFEYHSIYENPDFEIFENSNKSSNTLAWKAYGLYQKYMESNSIEDLKASQNTYDFYIYCAGENRKYFDNSSSIVTSSQVHYVYNQAINVTYLLHSKTRDRKYIEDIFKFIEGKKAFTLFQSLKILEQKKLLEVPKELLKLEEETKYQINLINEKIIAEKRNQNSKNTIADLQRNEAEYSLKLDSIQEIFKTEFSSFYDLKYGFKELSIDEINNQIDQDIAFINYSISDSLLHILTFTSDTNILVSQKIDSVFFKDIESMVGLLKEVDTDNSYDEYLIFAQCSYRLYSTLIKPIEDIIENHRLIFIPDDELNYISFDALIKKLPNTDRPDFRMLKYLIKEYKSNVANSMQIYFNSKTRFRNPNDKVYAFAPFYPLHPNPDSLPAEYLKLRPLDYAVLEVNNISRSMNTVTFIDEDATKDAFRKNAREAGILHLAMHTIIDDQKPLQSKFLFTHNSQNKSSMLNTYELLALELNAELAVLSGCSTGDGKLQKGEGVMSLSSGFQYAGVPAIVMSLWEVNDRFGSLVIHKFYENLANGLDKKQALYQAKLDVLKQGNALYAHPYYWAGLTLMGDESKIDFISRYQWDKLVIVFSPILFIVVVLFQTRRKWLIKRT